MKLEVLSTNDIYKGLVSAFNDIVEELEGDFDENDDVTTIRDAMIESLEDRKFEIIDNEIIYYHTCHQIVMALNYTHWDNNDLGIEVNGICDVAMLALYDFINDENIIYSVVDNFLTSKGLIEEGMSF